MRDNASFRIPIPQEPRGRPVKAAEAEELLLGQLRKCEAELEDAILELAIFYSRTNRQALATKYINRLIAGSDDPEKKADYLLKMGGLMEQMGNFQEALDYYRRAFTLEPANKEVWYYINNNLGYCLNHFGRYQEAEPYLRAAIGINPRRQNAYKNLGISLEGQNAYPEAARAYIQAVQANAGDPRALVLLQQLCDKHSELLKETPGLAEEIRHCQEAVGLARKLQDNAQARWRRKME